MKSEFTCKVLKQNEGDYHLYLQFELKAQLKRTMMEKQCLLRSTSTESQKGRDLAINSNCRSNERERERFNNQFKVCRTKWKSINETRLSTKIRFMER